MEVRRLPAVGLALLLLLVAGCASTPIALPRGPAAYDVIPAQRGDRVVSDFTISALDRVNVSVFQEPELTLQNAQVDASGGLEFPLLGTVRAAGKTPNQLAGDLEAGLRRYLVRPQVTVAVTGSATQTFAVEGEVNQPGTFEIAGSSSLLEALARAKSPTRLAKLNEVIVFRMRDGERLGAVFDLRRIRAGMDPDPEILAGDTVVVGYSRVRGIWRDFLSAVPLLNVFQRF